MNTGRIRAEILGAALLAVVGTAVPAQGQTLFSSSNGNAAFANALKVLDGRAAQQYSSSVRLTPHYQPDTGVIPAYRGSYRGEYLASAREAARKYDVPEDLFLRLIQQESGWNPGAVSNKGALGLAQLMPDTAARLGADASDPLENLDAGARYLRAQYERFQSWRLALAAYNAGPEAVAKYDGIPPYAETQGYVTAIMGG